MIVTLVAGVLLFIALLFSSSVLMADFAANRYPVAAEKQVLGKDPAEIAAALDVLPATAIESRLVNRIGADLLKALPEQTPYEYSFLVIDDSDPNAFAIPAGTIIIPTGMIDLVKTPEQLAAVIAHEIEHVEHRHGLKQMVQTAGVVSVIGMIFGTTQDMSTMTLRQLICLKYGRGRETEADIEGARLLVRAGIHPRAMVQTLELLGEEDEGWHPTLLSTHPNIHKRAQRIARLPEQQLLLQQTKPEWTTLLTESP